MNNNDTMIIKAGVINNRLTWGWKKAIENRVSPKLLDSMAEVNRPLTVAENQWLELIAAKTRRWNGFRDSLLVPFNDLEIADTIYILLGAHGVDDGFTFEKNTVCFDLTALNKEYGSASLHENSNRMDRLFAHEFTHLLHKTWAEKNRLELHNFRDSILWECIYEGIGMYRSLSSKWLPQGDAIPVLTQQTLDELYPVFVERLVTIAEKIQLSAEEKLALNRNLSRGPVNKKWGAFTVAIWLWLESRGNDKNLIAWIHKGPEAVLLLANKYLPSDLKEQLRNAK